jgi:transcriptional repressor NrdR
MRCPFCKVDDDRVVDSRASNDGFAIRRRRECVHCNRRYTTYERIEESPLRVVKKDQRREPFERRKVLLGLIKASEKRPIPIARLEEITQRIENRILERYETEVPVTYVGELVMEELKDLDQIAYVRFASVYREFKDLTEFMEEIKPLLAARAAEERPQPPAAPRATPRKGKKKR